MTEEESKQGAEEPKKPSKKELKKLAKKAEKAAAKKNQESKAKETPSGGGAAGKGAAAVAASVAPKRRRFRVSCGGAGATDAALTKIAIVAASRGVDVERSESRPVFGDGPAVGDVLGANAVCVLLSDQQSHDDEPTESDPVMVRECLELERVGLDRGRDRASALEALERILVENDAAASFLVGSSLSVADVCVVVTLRSLLSSENPPSLSPVMRAYVDRHAGSELFRNASSSPLLRSHFMNDPSMNRAVRHEFVDAVRAAFPDLDAKALPPLSNMITVPNNTEHGDYQCSLAMPLFHKLKATKSLPPNVGSAADVARAIAEGVGANDDAVLRDPVVAGPGFVLARVSPAYLTAHVNRLVHTGAPAPPTGLAPEKVVVDFSSPNIAKEMHVGHLRSTIIGESVCRILEYCGREVDRVNHVGDWGTQFGMLIQYLKDEAAANDDGGGGAGSTNDKIRSNISDLTVFYKNAKQRFDECPEFKKKSQNNVVLLQSGDPECRRMWNDICDVSRREFQKVYDRLDVTVEEKGESFYNERIPPVVDMFDKAGLLQVQEGGAKCVFVPEFKIPLMLQKSDGGYGYDSTDMAALEYRLLHLRANRVVYVTDSGQGDHFKMCFAAAKAIGWADEKEEKVKLCHIGFGTVNGDDGKRFKTRSGETVRLVDLLDEAVSRAGAELKGRVEAGKANISVDEISAVAAALGYGAVKYFDLRRNPTTSYKFSYDAMLDTKGNTAVYLLFAHARLESIVAKAKAAHGRDVDDLVRRGDADIVLGHPAEVRLAYALHGFTDAVEATLEDMYPYRICNQLYSTAVAASDFVTQCRVLGSDEMDSRLLLCRATAIVMRRCFDLLGIGYVMRI